MKNKTIKYKVKKGEDIGSIPYDSIILNAKLVCEGDAGDALIYFPRKVKYLDDDGQICFDNGCGSLGFAENLLKDKLWRRSNCDYLNLNPKESKKYENI